MDTWGNIIDKEILLWSKNVLNKWSLMYEVKSLCHLQKPNPFKWVQDIKVQLNCYLVLSY